MAKVWLARILSCSLLVCAALIPPSNSAFAQTTDPAVQQVNDTQPGSDSPLATDGAAVIQKPIAATADVCGPTHVVACLRDIGRDQAGIWTSPLRIKPRDAIWLAPLVGAAAVAMHFDAQAQQQLGNDASRIDTSNAISRFGSPYGNFAESGALYAIGRFTHNDHLAETGRLATEAVIDAGLVSEALKLATNRQRPLQGDGTGQFWAHGTGNLYDSFPSGHAMGSWALARVLASEYPNPLVQIGAYGFATAISVSRVTGRNHFPSDALVGSALGYLIGGYVVRHHSRRKFPSGFSFMPAVDMSTHTFGGSIELRPDQIDFARIGRLRSIFRLN